MVLARWPIFLNGWEKRSIVYIQNKTRHVSLIRLHEIIKQQIQYMPNIGRETMVKWRVERIDVWGKAWGNGLDENASICEVEPRWTPFK